MTRDELIKAAMDAAQNIPKPSRPIFDDDDERGVIAAVDAAEPLIRADERAHFTKDGTMSAHLSTYQAGQKYALADLRAKVEALRDESDGRHDFLLGKRFACQSVLNLIDGGGDG